MDLLLGVWHYGKCIAMHCMQLIVQPSPQPVAVYSHFTDEKTRTACSRLLTKLVIIGI